MIEYTTKPDCGISKAPTVIEASGPSLPTPPPPPTVFAFIHLQFATNVQFRCYNHRLIRQMKVNYTYMLFTGREVRIGKNCAHGLEYGPRPQVRVQPRCAVFQFSFIGFRAVTMTVVRVRKILPAPGTNQNTGFGGYRPLAH